jgi:hypothetical protein
MAAMPAVVCKQRTCPSRTRERWCELSYLVRSRSKEQYHRSLDEEERQLLNVMFPMLLRDSEWLVLTDSRE